MATLPADLMGGLSNNRGRPPPGPAPSSDTPVVDLAPGPGPRGKAECAHIDARRPAGTTVRGDFRFSARRCRQRSQKGAIRGLSDNGTVVVVKAPRGVSLTTLAVPMSLAAGSWNSCNALSAVGDLGRWRAYGAVYAGGVPDG